jgi:hypothetical protein
MFAILIPRSVPGLIAALMLTASGCGDNPAEPLPRVAGTWLLVEYGAGGSVPPMNMTLTQSRSTVTGVGRTFALQEPWGFPVSGSVTRAQTIEVGFFPSDRPTPAWTYEGTITSSTRMEGKLVAYDLAGDVRAVFEKQP